jgi:hypothetical protein
MKKLLYTLGFCLVLASMSTFTSCTADEIEPQQNVQNDDTSTQVVPPLVPPVRPN